MSVEIEVRGGRISPTEWDAIQALPKEELPPLSPEQKQVAQKMRIREEDYARSSLASKRGAENSLDKAERFARFLKERIKKRAAGATLRRVSLDDFQEKFEVEAQVDGRRLRFRVTEKLVDDLFESGSELAERRINRVLDLAFRTQP
jgi:flagellar motor protein MotB